MGPADRGQDLPPGAAALPPDHYQGPGRAGPARRLKNPKRFLTAFQPSVAYRGPSRTSGKRMYEAPDRYKRMISARLPGGESLAFSSGDGEPENSPLRDAQLL